MVVIRVRFMPAPCIEEEGSHPSSFTILAFLSLRNHAESDDSGLASARGLDPFRAGLRRTDRKSL